MAETIARFEQAYPGATTSFPEALAQLEEMLGVAHLHKAEMDNGAYRTPGDRCLLSPKPRRRWPTRAAPDTAIDYFSKALARRPGDGELTWLLNLAHMAAGSYPGGVPARRAHPAVGLCVGREHRALHRRGARARRRFVLVGGRRDRGRLRQRRRARDPDVQLRQLRRRCSCSAAAPTGAFHDQAARAGLSDELGGLNLLQADYDNDGCKDVLVLRGGWEQPQRKSLLRNNCDGTFTDVTVASGLANPATSTQTAAWADIDNDGFARPVRRQREPAVAAVPEHGERHVRGHRARRPAWPRTAFTKAVAAADYDQRRRRRTSTCRTCGGGNFLYRNNGNRTFTEVSAAAGVPGPERGFPDLVLRLRQRRLGRPARLELLPVGGRDGAPLSAAAAERRDDEALSQSGQRHVCRRDRAGVARPASTCRWGRTSATWTTTGILDIYLGTGSPSYAATVGARAAAQQRGPIVRRRHGRRRAPASCTRGTASRLPTSTTTAISTSCSRWAAPRRATRTRSGCSPTPDTAATGWASIWSARRTNRAAIGARIAVTVHGRRRCRAHGAPHGEQRRLVRRVTAAAAHRPWRRPRSASTSRSSGRSAERRSGSRNVPTNRILRVREGDDRYTEVRRAP